MGDAPILTAAARLEELPKQLISIQLSIQDQASLNLKIADFSIALRGLGVLEQKRGRYFLGPFLAESYLSPGLTVKVCNNSPIAEIPPQYHLFSSGSHWQLYQKNNQYYFKMIARAKKGPFISRLAVFPQDFRSGKIYTYSPVGDREFPLTYPLDQLLLIHLAALHQGVLVHGCGALLNGRGLLFIGSSGAGKSTIGALLHNYRDALILSDDRVMIRKKNDGWYLYGTPWQGTLPLFSAQRARLTRIFFLKKAKINKISPLSGLGVARRLVNFSFLPYWLKPYMEKTLSTVFSLAHNNIFRELSFLPDKRIISLIEDDLAATPR